MRGGYALAMQAVRRWWAALTTGPAYAATPADMRTVVLVGLRLPVRASVAVAVITFALLFDYSRTFLPDGVGAGRSPDAMAAIALERLVLFGIIPLAAIVLAFRDRPGRYGLTVGDWRWGIGLVAFGCLVMTPVVLGFASVPDVRAYYAESNAPIGTLLATNAIDLTATEFAFRGFLMLTLVRLIGPFGVLVATMPFIYSHLGKPELELFSTLGGGLIYGWLAWRTRSIVWGSIGHPYIVTLVTLAAAAG
jgi:membrane protease YdiL (CAAX protease family)